MAEQHPPIEGSVGVQPEQPTPPLPLMSNGANLDSERKPFSDSPKRPRDTYEGQNVREAMAGNQRHYQDTPTNMVNNTGRRERQTETVLHQSNTPEMDDDLARELGEVRQARRNNSLIQEAVSQGERRINVQESTLGSTEEIVEYLINENTNFETWLDRRLHGDEAVEMRRNLGARFMSNFRRFLDGEFDVTRGKGNRDNNLFRRNCALEIIRRASRAVINKKNLGGAAAVLGCGLLTGGIAPVVYYGLAGMVGGRLGAETLNFISGKETKARKGLMQLQYAEYEKQRRLAQELSDEHLPLDQRERWARELTETFFSASQELVNSQEKIAKIKDKQDKVSNFMSFVGSTGAMVGGGTWMYFRADGIESLYRYMGMLDTDFNLTFHTIQGNQFLYKTAEEATKAQLAGATVNYGLGQFGSHVLGVSQQQVLMGIAEKIGLLAGSGWLGSHLANIGNKSEMNKLTEKRSEIDERNSQQKNIILDKLSHDIQRSHEQETLTYIEGVAEQLGKSMPQEGEIWYIHDPDFRYHFIDESQATYNEYSGARFLIKHINPNNSAEIVLCDPSSSTIFPDNRATIPLVDIVEHMVVDPVRKREVDDANHRFEDWLRNMELDRHLVQQKDQPGEAKRAYLSQLEGAIVDFSIPPTTQIVDLMGGANLLSGKYKLVKIDSDAFQPYPPIALVDIDHITQNGVHRTVIISSEDLVRYGTRAYLPGELFKVSKSSSGGETRLPSVDTDVKLKEKEHVKAKTIEEAATIAKELIGKNITVTCLAKDDKGRPKFGQFEYQGYRYVIYAKQSDHDYFAAKFDKNQEFDESVIVDRIEKRINPKTNKEFLVIYIGRAI